MVKYLPEILDGLFQMLDDNSVEIQKMCETLLNHFLKTIKHDKTQADLQSMTNVLINHAQTNVDLIQVQLTTFLLEKKCCSIFRFQFTAISWIREFIQLSGPQMLKYASGIFTAILPCLAYDIESKRRK
jgi:vacuole morphology and inheritance protein 14